jgi:hypothetical protein
MCIRFYVSTQVRRWQGAGISSHFSGLGHTRAPIEFRHVSTQVRRWQGAGIFSHFSGLGHTRAPIGCRHVSTQVRRWQGAGISSHSSRLGHTRTPIGCRQVSKHVCLRVYAGPTRTGCGDTKPLLWFRTHTCTNRVSTRVKTYLSTCVRVYVSTQVRRGQGAGIQSHCSGWAQRAIARGRKRTNRMSTPINTCLTSINRTCILVYTGPSKTGCGDTKPQLRKTQKSSRWRS